MYSNIWVVLLGWCDAADLLALNNKDDNDNSNGNITTISNNSDIDIIMFIIIIIIIIDIKTLGFRVRNIFRKPSRPSYIVDFHVEQQTQQSL